MTSIYDVNVECEECGEVEKPDKPDNQIKWILGMGILFAGLGLLIGIPVGVATAGVGFAAWIFTVPIGMYVGYQVGKFGAKLMDGPSCPECGTEHSSDGLLPF